ncbi:MAG TPA: hypothetical protein P5294_01420 [Smithellaceae bacterium]|nr:hypothetical protein [Smithellaceae bacterium]HRS89300.1 hypothetical protein [Smithellaceae bacterium]HRV25170.1 hypothetical protein [Smithellaceae bacterium]
MAFEKIEYKNLNAKQQEIYNFQKIAAVLADYGFNCIKLSDDWQGADFIAYHKDGNETLKVQLKGRVNIDKKYLGKGLYVAFPVNGFWYLVEHDMLVEIIGKTTNWLNTPSWIQSNHYHSAAPSRELLEHLSKYRL